MGKIIHALQIMANAILVRESRLSEIQTILGDLLVNLRHWYQNIDQLGFQKVSLHFCNSLE